MATSDDPPGIAPTITKDGRKISSPHAKVKLGHFSSAAFGRWAFVTGRLQRDRRGKTDMPNG